MRNIWLDGIMGVITGDALGLPVQFQCRIERDADPLEDMIGYGTFHLPEGSWSDDGSMTMATLASIIIHNDICSADIMERFVDWYVDGDYTPFGNAFDQGCTCTTAIYRYRKEKDIHTCGLTGEYANGNGALMRILPVCIFAHEKVKCGEWPEEKAISMIHEVSALTHNHPRSKMACGIYYFLVKAVLDYAGGLKERLQEGMKMAETFYRADIDNLEQLKYYEELFDLDQFQKRERKHISSSVYVVDTLEAVLWCLLNTEDFREAMLKAANLGDDTDTVAAIAGGIAGLHYGYEGIPTEWLQKIQRREWVEAVCEEAFQEVSVLTDCRE